MLLINCLLLCGSALAYVQPSQKLYDLEEAESIFEDFIKKYNKVYANEEEKQMRFKIFKEKLELVNELMAERGRQATFDVNHFSDWTEEEFQSRYLGFKPSSMPSINVSIPVTMELPDSFDWRQKNAVTPVKEQGGCYSCWAFSTTGTIEGAYAIKHNNLLSFSEQQLVDCDKKNDACGGGGMDSALTYLQESGGIEPESDYPYVGSQNNCSFKAHKVKAQIVGSYKMPFDDDDAVKQALINYGPISIAVHASCRFQQYTGKILDCPSGKLNHAVLLVGYGTENEQPYWIIKNSWSTIWGEGGYARVHAVNNPCGMNSYGGIVALVK